MMSYLHTTFHDNWISSFRGVAMTRYWDGWTDGRTDGQTDGQTDGVTALLDLLSPSATQAKIKYNKRPMGLYSHLSLKDSTLTSCHICISTDPSNSLLVIIQLVFPMPMSTVEDFNKICKHKPPLWPNPSTKLPYPEGNKINNFCMPFPGHHYNILCLSDLLAVEKFVVFFFKEN